ncbi:LGFP repeat-containing protein [Nonomuraea sp. M3C6]|uniref:LGFP repeat-containing protein n=1 Tax=Nonomuraea marmarensis TaxID=3351344 RepID=A0ABW7ATZ1_9ACTN
MFRSLIAVITGLASIAISPAAAAARGCDRSLEAPAGSLIGRFWRSSGGPHSVYGCPTTKEYGYADKPGSWQRFANGTIGWSPDLGGGALVRVFSDGDLVLKWSGLARDWDFFNVRWSRDGGRTTQVKVRRSTPWSGQFVLAPFVSGGVGTTTGGEEQVPFAFIVQGCGRTTFGSECGPWSTPASIRVAH